MKRLLIRIAIVLVAIEIVYLAVANLLLNLPATQAFINAHQEGGRLAIGWDRAWSFFPFHIHATNFSLNAETWAIQIEATAPVITGRVALLPLLTKTINFTGIDTGDVAIHLRPLLEAAKDDAALRPFYPVIPGRDPNAPIGEPPNPEPGWKLQFDIASISGANDIWLAATRMTLTGTASLGVTIDGKNGPVTITDGVAEAVATDFKIAGNKISDRGTIKGTFDFASFLPQFERDMKMFAFMSIDADIDLPLEDLSFLNDFGEKVSGLKLDGRGGLKGHVVYKEGDAAPGTDVAVAADDLTVNLPPYLTHGNGQVKLTVDPARPDTLAAAFDFDSVSVSHAPDQQVLFTGTGIDLDVERTPRVLPGDATEKGPRAVSIAVSNVTVPNISAYQRYVPDEWNVKLVSGSGVLTGLGKLSGATVEVDVSLASDEAEVAFTTDSFKTGLEIGLKVKGEASAGNAKIDVVGTYLDLDDSRVKTSQGVTTPPWQTHLGIAVGEARFALPAEEAAAGRVGFWSLFESKDLKTLLSTVDGQLEAALTVSDLNWLSVFFKNPFSLALHTAAEVRANLIVEAGRLATGSTIGSVPQAFRLEILDYVAEGSGGFNLTVERGGGNPNLRLDAKLDGGSLRLVSEKEAVVDQVAVNITARSENVSLSRGGTARTVDMTIPTARVADMSVYNTYLPKGSPVRLLGGSANISAKLVMEQDNAKGFVKLKTSRLSADLDGNRLSGLLNGSVVIRSGSAAEKRFDISGSSLSVDDVRVAGASNIPNGWGARIDLGSSRIVWKQPMTLSVDGSLRMTDASPILAVFESNRKQNRWLDNMLNLKNIRADAQIRVTPNQTLIPYAFATSDTIDLGAKGLIRENKRQGVFYARYGALAGVLFFNNNQKRFDLIGATAKFKSYSAGGAQPSMAAAPVAPTPASTAAPPKKRSPFAVFKRK